ncbi:MAG TPA: hypothetical protein VK961_25360, partial [Chthoniobacter sp.]|nr:hypothetical protein [Chthoniobacter sp.]
TYVKNAEDAAAEAADFANATAVGIDLYKSILDKATLAGVKKIEGIKLATGSKWGGYISDKGELFTRLLNALKEKPQDLPTRTMAEKAVEQGQTFLDSTFNNVNDKIQELIDGVKKATKRVPVEYQRPLKQQIDKLNMMVIQMVNYKKKFQGDYDATHGEFQKLADAI